MPITTAIFGFFRYIFWDLSMCIAFYSVEAEMEALERRVNSGQIYSVS